jgi:hypothetical protein
MRLVSYTQRPEYRGEIARRSYDLLGDVSIPIEPPHIRTHVEIWVSQEELVYLFEPRSADDTMRYVAEVCFLDLTQEVTAEYEHALRGYRFSGVLDETRGMIDNAHMRIVPRSGQVAAPAPTGAAVSTPDSLQPVAKPARRRLLHL